MTMPQITQFHIAIYAYNWPIVILLSSESLQLTANTEIVVNIVGFCDIIL